MAGGESPEMDAERRLCPVSGEKGKRGGREDTARVGGRVVARGLCFSSGGPGAHTLGPDRKITSAAGYSLNVCMTGLTAPGLTSALPLSPAHVTWAKKLCFRNSEIRRT